MTEYRLGRSIASIVSFHRHIQKKQELITNKLVVTMVVIAIVKIAVFILWPI